MSTSAERMRRMRERAGHRARPADELLAPAVAETLAALDLGAEHAGPSSSPGGTPRSSTRPATPPGQRAGSARCCWPSRRARRDPGG